MTTYNVNFYFFISLLFGLQFLYWYIGQRSSKNLNNNEDYFLAGRSVKLFPLMMTFLATQVGGGTLLGAAEEAYHVGWPVILYPLGSALGLIILGLGAGSKLASFHVSTVAQIFQTVYGSKVLKKVASILSIVSLFMILIAQIIASSKFLISMGLDNKFLFIAFWAIVIIYTSKGGLKAVISTDIAQALYFSFALFLCFAVVLYSVPSVSLLKHPRMHDLAAVSDKISGWLLMPIFFMVIVQDMGQRCFAGASPRIVSQAALFSGIGTILICVIPVFFGSLARATQLPIPEGGSVLMTTIAAMTNPWITAIAACAVLAAIISTATSLINAISSNLSNDFHLSLFESIDPVKLAQGITCTISVAAILSAFYFDNIINLVIQSYELLVCCLFVPIIFAIFNQNRTRAAWGAVLMGAAAFVFFRFFPVPFRELLSLLLSLIGYGIGYMMGVKKNRWEYE